MRRGQGVAPIGVSSLSTQERAQIGGQYEAWLAAGFAQAAYMARDIERYGSVQPETRVRVQNERRGHAIEKLGEPFVTSFEYQLTSTGLIAEDGEPFMTIYERGYRQAIEDSVSNPELAFRANRHGTDVEHARFIEQLARDPSQPVGTAVIINSPSPDPSELGVSRELLEEYMYRPREQMAMQWVATKTVDGIRLQTLNLFHAAPEHLAEATSRVSGRPVLAADRESMVRVRTVFSPESGANVAAHLREAFDDINRQHGIQTYHGLQEYELPKSLEILGLTQTEAFRQELATGEYITEQIAQSLVGAELHVDVDYLKQILEMTRSGSRYELEGADRQAVLRVINSDHPTSADLHSALRVAQRASDSSLWATLRSLVDGKEVALAANTLQAASEGLGRVQGHRQAGSEEFGCPGGGSTKQKTKSIFDMSADELVGAFLRHTFITNCPYCEDKVVAERDDTNGTLTCLSCKACVDVCTGEVIQRSRKLAKVEKTAGTMASNSVGFVDWLMAQWRSSKVPKQKSQKRETIRV